MRRIHKATVAFARFSVDERGATAVEYGLIVGLIGGAVLAVVSMIGQDLVAILSGKLLEALTI
jgi:pilus assembly protein Flp/PilA